MAKKLKVGIIGTGFIARGAHIPGYNSMPDEVEIKWLCDIKPEALAESLKMAPDAKTTADYHDLLNDPEVDAVSICTPNLMHLQPALDALAAGKHVLCEKPLAVDAIQAARMHQAARDADRLLVEAVWCRWHPRFRRLAELASSGGLGDLLSIDSAFTFPAELEDNYRARAVYKRVAERTKWVTYDIKI